LRGRVSLHLRYEMRISWACIPFSSLEIELLQDLV
jgi:hypothetical protein